MVNRINRGGRFIPPAAVNNYFLRRAGKVARRGKPISRSGRPGGWPRWPATGQPWRAKEVPATESILATLRKLIPVVVHV